MFSLQTAPLLPEIELRLGDHIIDMWLKLRDDTAPHWAFAWAGGIALARYTLDHRSYFENRTVVDIGCGSGINTVAAIMSGAKFVYAVDRSERSRDLTIWNAVHNDLTDRVIITDKIPPLVHIDTVLLGDVFYENADLMTVADAALISNCTVLIGSAESREYTPLRRCQTLETYTVPNQQLLEARETVQASVYRYIPEEYYR